MPFHLAGFLNKKTKNKIDSKSFINWFEQLFESLTCCFSCTVEKVKVGRSIPRRSAVKVGMSRPKVDDFCDVLVARSNFDQVISQRSEFLILCRSQKTSWILVPNYPVLDLLLLNTIWKNINKKIQTSALRSLRRISSSFCWYSPIIKIHIKSPPIFTSKNDRTSTFALCILIIKLKHVLVTTFIY